MDSKLALELLTTFLKPTVWKDGFEIRNIENGEAKTIDEIVDMIYGDLEILDIIKNAAYIFHFEDDKVSSIGICEQSNLTKEEIDKLGKWLLKERNKTRWVNGVKGISSPSINLYGYYSKNETRWGDNVKDRSSSEINTYGYNSVNNLYKYPINNCWKSKKEQCEGTENTIVKDLELLEILKKKKVVIDWNSNDVFTFDEHLTKEEENKIKEWMKNDN